MTERDGEAAAELREQSPPPTSSRPAGSAASSRPAGRWARIRQVLFFLLAGPRAQRLGEEDLRRVVVVSAISAIGVVTIVALAFVAIRQANWTLAVADVAAATFLVANQTYLRLSGNIRFSSIIGVALAGALFFYLFVSGGAFHTGHLWYYVFPLVCSHVLGARRGLVVFLLLLVPTLSFLFFVDGAALGLATYSFDFSVRFIPSLVLVGTYSYLAESSRERKNADLRDTVEELEQTSVALEKARSVLEQRVAERTAELVSANQQLQQEIAEKERERDDRQRLEQQLQHAQKMQAIGTLAGGIAHDFNNLLVPIMGYAQLVIAKLPDDGRERRHLGEVIRAAERAQGLVKQILTFSRKREIEFGPLRMQPLIKEALGFLRASLPAGVEMKAEIDPDCGHVLGEPTLIHQALLNLCTNAFHAMKDCGGVLEVSLQSVEIGPDAPAVDVTLAVGSYARLTVRDTGHGMSPDTLDRVFDPYFTTKPLGEGTGLGLSVLHGIVRRHSGEVTVESTLGEGTVFSVWLPLAQTAAEPSKAEPSSTGALERLRVLLVDDEQMVREVAGAMLSSLGCRVTTRPDCKAALEAFSSAPDDFDLVITDHSMPRGMGTDLVCELRKVRSDLPVVLSTGYADEALEARVEELAIDVLLSKPFTLRKLASALERAIGQ